MPVTPGKVDYELDVNTLAPGIYVIQLTDCKGSTQNLKLVKAE